MVIITAANLWVLLTFEKNLDSNVKRCHFVRDVFVVILFKWHTDPVVLARVWKHKYLVFEVRNWKSTA